MYNLTIQDNEPLAKPWSQSARSSLSLNTLYTIPLIFQASLDHKQLLIIRALYIYTHKPVTFQAKPWSQPAPNLLSLIYLKNTKPVTFQAKPWSQTSSSILRALNFYIYHLLILRAKPWSHPDPLLKLDTY